MKKPSHHWNYRVIEFVDPTTQDAWRAIHEVHYTDGVPTSYTEQPAIVWWDVAQGNESAANTLDMMRHALQRAPLIERDFMKPEGETT